jgi:hypothetical protein
MSHCRFSDILPDVIHVLVMHHREQPGFKISPGLPELFLDKRTTQRVLHQIVCPVGVARERSRVAPQSRDLLSASR